MTMTPSSRKLLLTAHIILSVGWLGAVVAYLTVSIVGLTSSNAQTVLAAYLSMEVVGWFVIVPFSLATVLVGLVESLSTPWGLFQQWWVSMKFLLTIGATIVLLGHMPAVTRMATVARDMTLSATDFRTLRIQLVVHAVGGLLVLLSATVLSLYKPWGMTPYGLRMLQERNKVLLADVPSILNPTSGVPESTAKTPRWVYVVGFHAIGLVLFFLVVHLIDGGVQSH